MRVKFCPQIFTFCWILSGQTFTHLFKNSSKKLQHVQNGRLNNVKKLWVDEGFPYGLVNKFQRWQNSQMNNYHGHHQEALSECGSTWVMLQTLRQLFAAQIQLKFSDFFVHLLTTPFTFDWAPQNYYQCTKIHFLLTRLLYHFKLVNFKQILNWLKISNLKLDKFNQI